MTDGDDEPEGFDISWPGRFEGSKIDKEEAVRTSLDRINQLTSGGAAMREALHSIGGSSALSEAARAASSVSFLKDQLDALSGANVFNEKFNAHQESMRALSLPDMTDHISALAGLGTLASHFKAEQDAFTDARNLALGGLPEGFMNLITGSSESVVSRLVRRTHEHSMSMFQKIDVFADMRRALEASSLFDLASAVNIPRFGSAIETLGFGRIGSAIEAANAVHLLGLSPTFHDQFKSVATSLSEQASAFARVRDVASASVFDFDLAGNLESMLVRSLAAHEALHEEQKGAAKDAKADAAFNRRIAAISVIINILMLFLSIALQLEERLTDGDAGVRANTEALVEMRNSFDAMASQLEAMKETQQADTERQNASDSDIADILRGIAKTLSQQAEMDTETGAGEGQLNNGRE